MHLRFNFDACPMHSPFGFMHLTHQNLNTRALFCLNSLAKVNTQLLIYNKSSNWQPPNLKSLANRNLQFSDLQHDILATCSLATSNISNPQHVARSPQHISQQPAICGPLPAIWVWPAARNLWPAARNLSVARSPQSVTRSPQCNLWPATRSPQPAI